MEALNRVDSEFSQEALGALKKSSPTSLKVTLEQLRRGSLQTIHDCFVMEYNMTQHILVRPRSSNLIF